MARPTLLLTPNALHLSDLVAARFGIDSDAVMVLNSNTLAANTSLTLGGTSILVGTVVGQALAANSLILSSLTASGDMGLYANRGGNSEQFLFYDTSAGVLYLVEPTGGILLGLAAAPPAPDAGAVHIWDGSAGDVSALTGAKLVIENGNAETTYLQFLTNNNQATGIAFGDTDANNAGIIFYSHISNSFVFYVEAVARLSLTTNTLQFEQASNITTITGALTLAPAGALNLQNAVTDTIGFFGVTAVDQEAGIVNADGTLADITTKFNTLLSSLEAYGLLAVA